MKNSSKKVLGSIMNKMGGIGSANMLLATVDMMGSVTNTGYELSDEEMDDMIELYDAAIDEFLDSEYHKEGIRMVCEYGNDLKSTWKDYMVENAYEGDICKNCGELYKEFILYIKERMVDNEVLVQTFIERDDKYVKRGYELVSGFKICESMGGGMFDLTTDTGNKYIITFTGVDKLMKKTLVKKIGE